MKTFDSVETPLVENVDYELIPGDGENWNVRLLEGPFPETVIQFGQLRMADDGEHLKFNFDVVSSPDGDLTDENEELQQHASDVLGSILEHAARRVKEESEESE